MLQRRVLSTLQNIMKAIRVEKFGGPEVLQLKEVPVPTPGSGEVLVRVRAVGINPVETYIRAGAYARKPELPFTPGNDCAGTVEATGSEVTPFKPGDRVFVSRSNTGAYAEYTLANADFVHGLPDSLSYQQGAALAAPYLTAHRALFCRGGARPGQTLLVHGASGGVGVAAVQMGRALGMRVIGTAGTDKGMDCVTKAGAHHTFNHRLDGYITKIVECTPNGLGPDLILENAAHLNLGRDLEILAPGGRVVVIGSRGPVQINPRDTMRNESSVVGVMLFNASKSELQDTHAAIQAGIEAGWLRPIVGKEFPIVEAPAAHEDIINGDGAIGKMVLNV